MPDFVSFGDRESSLQHVEQCLARDDAESDDHIFSTSSPSLFRSGEWFRLTLSFIYPYGDVARLFCRFVFVDVFSLSGNAPEIGFKQLLRDAVHSTGDCESRDPSATC